METLWSENDGLGSAEVSRREFSGTAVSARKPDNLASESESATLLAPIERGPGVIHQLACGKAGRLFSTQHGADNVAGNPVGAQSCL
jgi:hypothetical protein